MPDRPSEVERWYEDKNRRRESLGQLRRMTDDELIELAEMLDENLGLILKVMAEREKDIIIPAKLVKRAYVKKLP